MLTLPDQLSRELAAFDRTLSLALEDETRKLITAAAEQLVVNAYARGVEDGKAAK